MSGAANIPEVEVARLRVAPSVRYLPAALVGVALGILALGGYRFAFVPLEQPTHLHANFALFVEGRRVDLSGSQYMEEVGACRVGGSVYPVERAHLHANNPDIAHIHHEGVTWGHLMANLGFGLGAEYLAMNDGRIFSQAQGRTLKFILNGQPQFSVHNELIRSGERLLISYGPENPAEVIRTQFPAVASNAEEFNRRNDPAGCSGAKTPTVWDRVRHAFVG